MSVVAHFSGMTSKDAIPKLTRAVNGLEEMFTASEGYERAEMLVNHAELRVQFMIQFSSFETCLEFLKRRSSDLLLRFTGLVKDMKPPFVLALEGEIAPLGG